MVDIADTLKERGARYGKFTDHSRYTQAIKQLMMGSPNWVKMTDDEREGLDMIAHKIGRILSGDPHYADNWHDIVGYAKLVDDRLQQLEAPITKDEIITVLERRLSQPRRIKILHTVIEMRKCNNPGRRKDDKL